VLIGGSGCSRPPVCVDAGDSPVLLPSPVEVLELGLGEDAEALECEKG